MPNVHVLLIICTCIYLRRLQLHKLKKQKTQVYKISLQWVLFVLQPMLHDSFVDFNTFVQSVYFLAKFTFLERYFIGVIVFVWIFTSPYEIRSGIVRGDNMVVLLVGVSMPRRLSANNKFGVATNSTQIAKNWWKLAYQRPGKFCTSLHNTCSCSYGLCYNYHP